MKNIGAYLLACLPSFLHVPIRRMLGAKIGKGAKIHFGTVIACRKITLEKRAAIGPFSYIQGDSLFLGEEATIGPLVFIVSWGVTLGAYAQIASIVFVKGALDPKSQLTVGDHSRIF